MTTDEACELFYDLESDLYNAIDDIELHVAELNGDNDVFKEDGEYKVKDNPVQTKSYLDVISGIVKKLEGKFSKYKMKCISHELPPHLKFED